MTENNEHPSELEERIKKLETLQRNTRIAIIILVGYSVYDVISKDTGSALIYADTVKAKEFRLVDGTGGIFGTWKLIDEDNRVPGLVIQNPAGKKLRLKADELSLLEGRTNPISHLTLNESGLNLHEPRDLESDPAAAE